MSKELLAYLDVSGPEYDYLGHFREHEWLDQGHNDLAIEDQIEAGSIPNLGIGSKNLPAVDEPGNIAQSGLAGTSAGSSQTAASQSTKGQGGGGIGNALAGTIIDYATGSQAQDFSSGEGTSNNFGATLSQNLGHGSAITKGLTSLFDL